MEGSLFRFNTDEKSCFERSATRVGKPNENANLKDCTETGKFVSHPLVAGPLILRRRPGTKDACVCWETSIWFSSGTRSSTVYFLLLYVCWLCSFTYARVRSFFHEAKLLSHFPSDECAENSFFRISFIAGQRHFTIRSWDWHSEAPGARVCVKVVEFSHEQFPLCRTVGKAGA